MEKNAIGKVRSNYSHYIVGDSILLIENQKPKPEVNSG
jgi:hypothetical protein